MKIGNMSKSLVLGCALLLASSAFAAKASLQLNNPVTLNGTNLKAGDYKVIWEGAGPNVEVSIMQGSRVCAKVPGHMVDLSTPSPNNAAVTKKNDDGTLSLTEVRIEGKKFALDVAPASDNMQAGSTK